MSVHIVKRAVTVASCALIVSVVAAYATARCAAFGPFVRRAASPPATAPSPVAQPPTPARVLPPGTPLRSSPGQRGATYYALEARSSRVTTSFTDGTKAVAHRRVDGDTETALVDTAGNEVNRFIVDSVDGVNDVLQYTPFGGAPVLVRAEPSVRLTLDWANRQSHQLHRDGVASGAALEWRNGVVRKAGADTAAETDRDVLSIETAWADGLSARTTRVPARGTTFDGSPVKGDVLATKLFRDGVEVGHAYYLTAERIFTWGMPGVSEGTIGNEHLKQNYGGWPFTPDMVWMNLQTIATFHWRSLLKANGTLAVRSQPRRNRIVEFFAPTLSANDEGCDRLHYLDGTVYRACCDQHDRCYSNNGCTATTWWWWGSWSCNLCNVGVIACFLGMPSEGHILTPYGG